MFTLVRKPLRLKACPRCRGDLHLEEYIEGNQWECIQCGFYEEVEEPPKISSSPRRAGGKYRGMGVDTHGLD